MGWAAGKVWDGFKMLDKSRFSDATLKSVQYI